MLPHFIGIGVPKAGTTSVHRYLAQHPGVCMSQTKEPHFFLHADGPPAYRGPGDGPSTSNDVYDLATYKALFDGGRGKRRGEISPQYFADPAVPHRIKKLLPDARFLLMLREPVARAYSNFLHMRRVGREPESSFKAALAKESQRLEAGWEPFWGYRTHSLYGQNSRAWLRTFGRDRFKVVTLRDLATDPAAVMRGIYEFIGVDAGFEADHLPHNVGGIGGGLGQRMQRASPLGGLGRLLPLRARRSLHLSLRRWTTKYPDIKPRMAERLRAEFRPDVEEFEDAFGLDLWYWKDQGSAPK